MDLRTRKLLLAAFIIALVALVGCAPGSERFVEKPAGFWAGLWHGFIIIVTFVVSLFAENVRVYEAQNAGGWYDFGFVLGVLLSVGGCFDRRHKRWRQRVRREQEWDEIARKVERRVRRGIDQWLEESDHGDDEWSEIGRKIEEKIRRELRDRADSQHGPREGGRCRSGRSSRSMKTSATAADSAPTPATRGPFESSTARPGS